MYTISPQLGENSERYIDGYLVTQYFFSVIMNELRIFIALLEGSYIILLDLTPLVLKILLDD